MRREMKLIDELIHHQADGTRISLYVPVTGENSRAVYEGLRRQALRLLHKAGDSELASAFEFWSENLFRPSTRSKCLAAFFSKTLRKVEPLESEVPPRIVVSGSFHVKPLLFGTNRVPTGVLVEVHRSGITLWGAPGEELELIDYLQAPIPDANWPQTTIPSRFQEYCRTLGAMIPAGAYVHVSGAPEGMLRSRRFWEAHSADVTIDGYRFGFEERDEARKKFLSRLKLWRMGQTNAEVSRNLRDPKTVLSPEEIMKGIQEKRLRSLTVSLEALRWGRIDEGTGKVNYHRLQLDHRDDDVLDDLVELALKNGVDVRVVRQTSLPGKIDVIAS